jgi:hypothetical protein
MINTVICVKCKKELRWKQSGVLVLFTNGSKKPVRAAYADLYRCDKCDADMLTGFGIDVPITSIQDCINSENRNKDTIYQIPL